MEISEGQKVVNATHKNNKLVKLLEMLPPSGNVATESGNSETVAITGLQRFVAMLPVNIISISNIKKEKYTYRDRYYCQNKMLTGNLATPATRLPKTLKFQRYTCCHLGNKWYKVVTK